MRSVAPAPWTVAYAGNPWPLLAKEAKSMEDLARSAAGGSGLVLLNPALAKVVRETGASTGMVFLLPPGEQVLQLAVITGMPQPLTAPWARIPVSAPLPVAVCVRERRLVWLGSNEEVARQYPRLGLIFPYDAVMAAVPIMADLEARGALLLVWPGWHPRQLAVSERAMVDACCQYLGLVLKHAADQGHPLVAGPAPRALAPPRAGVAGPTQAMAAVEFIDRLPGGCCTLDPDGRFTFITDTATELLGEDTHALMGRKLWEALPWLDNPRFGELYRAAALTGQPASTTALRPPDRWLSFRLYPAASGISLRIIPVTTKRASSTEGEPRPARSTQPSRVTILYHLLHLAATLAEAATEQDVVAQIADQLVPGFGAQALALMAVEKGRLRIVGHRGYSRELIDRFDAAPLSSDLPVARILATGTPAFFADRAELAEVFPGPLPDDTMAAWAFLPLIASGSPIGALVLAYQQPHLFGSEDRTILSSLAGLIAQALDRARLYDTKDTLARVLQAGLLPHALPRIPGLDAAARYLPATRHMDVGGDFYDLIPLGSTAVAATIGDVQGHNVNAAAVMGQVRTAVRANAGAPPGEVLARTNRLLSALDAGLLTSCLYAHLDLANDRAQLATAGHLPPLLRHPDGHTEPLGLQPGLLLGVDEDADYPTTEAPLPPGSILALYTDGLVEVPGVDLDHGIADLADQLAQAQDLTVDVLADRLVGGAAGAVPRSDDIALLLVSRLG